MKRNIPLLIIAFLATSSLIAQDFEVPKHYKLEKKEDYAPYEEDLLKSINFLLETPLDEKINTRNEANTFVLKWLMGSPYIHIEIHEKILNFMETSPDMLMIFMSGWAKFSIESKDYDNTLAGAKAGIEAVMDVYGKNRKMLKKDKNIEKYIKRKEKGELEAFLKENLSS